MQMGNPYLRPVKYHNLNVMAMWKGFYLTTNFVHCVDPFLRVVESMEQDSKVNVATTKNYNDCNWLIVTLGTQKSVSLASGVTWTPQYNATLMKQWLTTTYNGQDKRLDTPMLSLQLGNVVSLPHDWLVQADFNMHTHGYTGSNFRIETTNALLSLGVSKDLFRRRLNIKLTGNDLFNQGAALLRPHEDDEDRGQRLALRYPLPALPHQRHPVEVQGYWRW